MLNYKLLSFIVLGIAAIWYALKVQKARNVRGSHAEIHPFRRESLLIPLGVLHVTIDQVLDTKDGIWFKCLLDREYAIGEFTFNYIMLKVKSVDDNLNKKKPVITYVHGGHSARTEEPKFIDWGLVKLV